MLVLVLYSYLLGGVWEIGPFTDMKSCQSARMYQLAHGVTDVSPCRPVNPSLAPRTPLTPDKEVNK